MQTPDTEAGRMTDAVMMECSAGRKYSTEKYNRAWEALLAFFEDCERHSTAQAEEGKR